VAATMEEFWGDEVVAMEELGGSLGTQGAER
jgi:hypothetical protein